MLMTNDTLIDILGWFGAAALLIAYALISSRRVEGDSTPYQSLNIAGSILLMVNTIHYGAYPSAFVNLIWLAIAFYAIRKTLTRAFAGSAKE